MRSGLRLLRAEPDFRRVYLGQLVSLGGDWFVLVPLLGLLLRLTGSGLWGGLALGADTLVFALLSPYAGTVVDRLDRRRVMVIADLASVAATLTLLGVHSSGTAWLALLGVGGVAAAKAFAVPAGSAALPNLVGPADLGRANALTGATWGVTLAVGGAAGGLLSALVGPRWCFGLDAASFAVSALLVARTRRAFQEPNEAGRTAGIRAALAETRAYTRRHPRVALLLLAKSGVGVGNGTIALFPLLAAALGAGPLGLGLLFSARGLGGLLGPLLLRSRAGNSGRVHGVLFASMLLYAAGYLGAGWLPLFPLLLVVVVAAHVGGGANWTLSTYGLQRVVPDGLRGRVFSTDLMIATLAVGLSQTTAGALTTVVDVRVLTSCFGALTLIYALCWYAAVRRTPAERLPADCLAAHARLPRNAVADAVVGLAR